MRIERIIQGKELEDFLAELEKNDGYCNRHMPETKCMCKEFLEQQEGDCPGKVYHKYKD